MCHDAGMGWVQRWADRTNAKDRARRQMDLEKDSLRRAIPVEPVTDPDNVAVAVAVRESGAPPNMSGEPAAAAIEILWGFVAMLRYRDGFSVWLQAPGYRTVKLRHRSELEALAAVAGVVDRVRTTGATGVGLRQSPWFMRRRRR